MQELLQEAMMRSNKGSIASLEIKNIQLIGDGKITKTWNINLKDGGKLFAKTTQYKDARRIYFEAEGLNALNKFTDKTFLQIPQPFAIERVSNLVILLLPWLDVGIGNQRLLGTGLALLHKKSAQENPGSFGWKEEGFIGDGLQPRGCDVNWGG